MVESSIEEIIDAIGYNPMRDVFDTGEINFFKDDVKAAEISKKQVNAGIFEKIKGEQEMNFQHTPEGLTFTAQ